jgi:hypothetical protein
MSTGKRSIDASRTRKAVPVDIKQLILHEGGYKCANPACRQVLTLEIHHLEPVSTGGGNVAENLLALCPNCHSLHHAGQIPIVSLRAWKQLLLALNEAFDRRSVDLLLALRKLGSHYVTGDGVLQCAALVASGLVVVRAGQHDLKEGPPRWDFGGPPLYTLSLSERGERFVAGWEDGNQKEALGSFGAAT